MRSPAPHRRSRRGAQAIEFAFVAPVFLAFITGIMDFAWYFSRDSSFRHAVHRAARVAASTSADDDVSGAFTTALTAQLSNAGFTMSPSATATVVGTSGDRFLEVDATMPWTGLTGLTPQPVALKVTLRSRMEDQEPVDTGG